MCGRGGQHARAIRAPITGTAAPLPIKHLDRSLAWHVRRIQDTESSHLSETVIADPALFGGAVMRMCRDVGMQILGVALGPQQHRARQSETQ
jgi:hypothetical protein